MPRTNSQLVPSIHPKLQLLSWYNPLKLVWAHLSQSRFRILNVRRFDVNQPLALPREITTSAIYTSKTATFDLIQPLKACLSIYLGLSLGYLISGILTPIKHAAHEFTTNAIYSSKTATFDLIQPLKAFFLPMFHTKLEKIIIKARNNRVTGSLKNRRRFSIETCWRKTTRITLYY